MKYIKPFNESDSFETEVIITGKRNPSYTFSVFKTPDGRISRIENPQSIRFPYQVGELFNRSIEVWACNNNFYIDGKDTCPEEKVFGIRKKDIPQGHELRRLFPHKFR